MIIRALMLGVLLGVTQAAYAAGIPFVPSTPKSSAPPDARATPSDEGVSINNPQGYLAPPTQIGGAFTSSFVPKSSDSQPASSEYVAQPSGDRPKVKSAQEVEVDKQVNHLRKMTEKLSQTSCAMTEEDKKRSAQEVVKRVNTCLKNQYTQLKYQKEQINNVMKATEGLR